MGWKRRRSRSGLSRRSFLAGGALIAGGGALAGSTGAFSQIDAGRTTNIATAADDEALLSVTGRSDPETPVSFTNRMQRLMVVTLTSPDDLEFDVGNDDTSEGSTATFDLASETTVDVDLLGDGTVTIDVDAEIREGGATVGRIQFQRTAEAQSQAGQFEVTGAVKSAGNSGKYEFEVENTGDVDVTIEAIGINETTNGNAAKVGGRNKDDVLVRLDQNTSIVSEEIPIDSNSPEGDTRVDFDEGENVSLPQGAAVTFEFDVFRTDNNNKAGMKGEDVRTTLYFTDGSSATVELCLNGCSF